MPDARTPRLDDRPPAGLSAGLVIVAAVIAVHLFFALLIGVGGDDRALPDVGPGAACVGGPGGTGTPGGSGACGTPTPIVPGPPSDTPAATEPASGGRGSY